MTGIVSAFLLATACVGGGEDSDPPTTGTGAPTSAVENDEAGAAFIAAWSRGDSEEMRRVADGAVVETALRFGHAGGSPECSAQRSGQYQCIVEVSAGKRMYILVGEPGDRTGRVWWVSEYHPDS
ncbi:MAG TPA: hypothetical protein VG078_03520 [Acidimicrobiales bacterium]|nr:hypothetical protein [Acidimicrobiales bacterium]